MWYTKNVETKRKTQTASFSLSPYAPVAQLVEQLICNQQVAGSSPTRGSIILTFLISFFLPFLTEQNYLFTYGFARSGTSTVAGSLTDIAFTWRLLNKLKSEPRMSVHFEN